MSDMSLVIGWLSIIWAGWLILFASLALLRILSFIIDMIDYIHDLIYSIVDKLKERYE